jgi:hypothetical protein
VRGSPPPLRTPTEENRPQRSAARFRPRPANQRARVDGDGPCVLKGMTNARDGRPKNVLSSRQSVSFPWLGTRAVAGAGEGGEG